MKIFILFAVIFLLAESVIGNDIASQSTYITSTTTGNWSLKQQYYDRENNDVIWTEDGQIRGKLRSLKTVTIEDFVPLSCNANLGTTNCQSWMSIYGRSVRYQQRVTIPCGVCILMDHPEPTVTFLQGIEIIGKIVFPDKYKIIIQTSVVVVQGELIIKSKSQRIDGRPNIKFIFTGETNQTFVPVENNINACGGKDIPCNVGKKAIVVAGGTIQGTTVVETNTISL